MSLDQKVRCLACGYDLAGLRPAGRCPECGARYDTKTGQGVLKRSAALEASDRGDRLMMWLKVAALGLVAAVSLIIGLVRTAGNWDDTGPLVVGGIFAGAFAFAAWVVWFTEGRG